jgi:hypothetical protein
MASATDTRRDEVTQAHRKSVESSASDMAAFLQDALGQKFVAYIIGTDARTIGRWAEGGNARGENERKLQATFYIFRLLSEVESSHTVRAWFAGMNPLLDDESPATNIREGRLREALGAARAFVAEG